jgi:hypothetical protein
VLEERDVERALDTMELFLKAIQSPEAAQAPKATCRKTNARTGISPFGHSAALNQSIAGTARCERLSISNNHGSKVVSG